MTKIRKENKIKSDEIQENKAKRKQENRRRGKRKEKKRKREEAKAPWQFSPDATDVSNEEL